MKKAFAIILILFVAFGAGYYLGSKGRNIPQDMESVIVYDTVYIEMPDTIFITKDAEVIYKTDTTVVTEYLTVEQPEAHIIEFDDTYIAQTDIEVGDHRVHIEYDSATRKFNIEHYRFREVIPRIERAPIPAVVVGVQASLFTGKEPMLNLTGLIGFPRIINNLYLNFGAHSDKSIGVGLTYIF